MPTIDSEQLIKQLILGDGMYDGDPQCLSIHSYINSWDNQTYHVSYYPEHETALFTSPYCNDIKTLWDVRRIPQRRITEDGRGFLAKGD